MYLSFGAFHVAMYNEWTVVRQKIFGLNLELCVCMQIHLEHLEETKHPWLQGLVKQARCVAVCKGHPTP